MKTKAPLINPFDESTTKRKSYWKIKTLVFLVLVIAGIIGLNIFFNRYYLVTPILIQSPIRIRGTTYPVKISEPELDQLIEKEVKLQVEPSKTSPVKARETNDTSMVRKGIWNGQASVYTEEGCLGCDPNLITASGEKLDDHKLTLAFNHLPMKTMVKVTNSANGLHVIAKVNDTGGFAKYNRIADLNKATAEAINCKGLCNVLVEEI